MSIKYRLILMNLLQYGVWGAYLTSMGSYLASSALAEYIGYFYAMQGIVSLFMPALMGVVADRWVPAQRLLGVCHLLAALFIGGAWFYTTLPDGGAWPLFALYSLSVMFYMPTIALSYSVAYNALEGRGEDPVRSYPPIRVWGTVGFIVAMLVCDFAGWQLSSAQFLFS
ncbi:MAG: MFS transporter, partial [Alistipes sp.]|nr:MFS transporter [Alistipes sp.]